MGLSQRPTAAAPHAPSSLFGKQDPSVMRWFGVQSRSARVRSCPPLSRTPTGRRVEIPGSCATNSLQRIPVPDQLQELSDPALSRVYVCRKPRESIMSTRHPP